MKKIVILGIVIFWGSASLIADCPEGYSRYVIRSVYSCGCLQCSFNIVVCCKWNPETHKLEYIIDEYESATQGLCCINAMLSPDFGYFLDTSVSNNVDISCIGMPYPPCDHPTLNYYEVEINKPVCIYYKYAFMPPFLGDEPMWLLRVKRCAQLAYCRSKYRVCMDYSQSPPVTRRTLVERYVSAWCEPSNCPTTLPPPGKSWEEPWQTECCFQGCN